MENAVLNKQSDLMDESGSGDSTYRATDYFLGIAQRAIASGNNTRITLPGKGEVNIYPQLNTYDTDVLNMSMFCQAPVSKFETVALGASERPKTPGKSICELLWQAAFYASQGRMIEGCSKYDVVQFRHWPNLSRLPQTTNTMRITALLTRYPTTIMLLPRRLGATKEEVFQTYSAAYCSGLVNMVSRNPDLAATEPAEQGAQEQQSKTGLWQSLFAKISGL
jgi:hypothetical protein